jgi:type IV pilus assembly protein PilM
VIALPLFSEKHKLGLDIGSAFIKVCLPNRSGKPVVARVATPEGSVSKGVLQNAELLRDALRQMVRQQNLTNNQVVATLPASTLVLRHIQIPMLKPRETAEAVEWEARRVLPFALEEAQMDWLRQGTVVSEEGEMQDILLVAVRDAVVERYISAVQETGLKLVALDVAPLALGRWLLKGSEGSSLIMDMGSETTQLHFFVNSKLIFSRSLSIGGVQASRAIQNYLGNNFAESETLKLRGEYQEEWLEAWHSELGREIQRSLEYYHSNFNNFDNNEESQFDRVILSGGASSTRGIEELIKDITSVEPGYAEFSSRLRTPRHDRIMYNVALGAGLWEGK